nr:LOW QUALITY PROTEIN: sialic acid-binding Ig-like lectin 16 [Pelodiscus sinensis]|eukprot:XP_025036349.1 LOW QUALITY PROTEIN: sialic acid-binding Ig-like lectin 16 [Pelodiscus sinensis]
MAQLHKDSKMLTSEGDVVSLETCEGDSLSLGCAAKSSPQATLSWTNVNESLSPGQGGAGWLELPSLSPEDAGEYRCRAENPYGSASRSLRVLVQSPLRSPQISVSRANSSGPQQFPDPSTVVANGSQLSAQVGDSLRFLCSVPSCSPANLSWERGDQGRAPRAWGENPLWLELPNVTAQDGGLYRCRAQSEESSDYGTFQLLIECCGAGGQRPPLPRLRRWPTSLIYSNIATIPMPLEAPATEYSEIRLK